MRYPLFIFLLIGGGKCFSQITLHFVNEHKENVAFVYAFDSSGKFHAAADSSGRLLLPKGSYQLLFDHVSYEQETKDIFSDENKELLIVLSTKKKNLEEVVVSASSQKNKKTYEEGSFSRNAPSGTALHQNIKMGLVSPHPINETSSCRLTGIQFKLHKIPKKEREDFIMEIRIYAIENREISAAPLNDIPIYISSAELKKKNTVILKEFIPIGEEGVFVSFEIPKISSDKSVIAFAGAFDAETALCFFQGTAKPNWEANTIKRGGHRLPDQYPYNGKYFTPEISILYMKMND